MKHVIIGAGPAGVIAAETLRAADAAADITLIGDEPEPPYSRMAIPYVLTGKIDETGTYLRKQDGYFSDQAIDVVRGRAEKVAPDAKTVTVDGKDIAYDRLLIATGSRPAKPPIPGLDLPGIHHCWTLEDSRQISNLAAAGSKVVLMGAGFIGCIILEALVERGVNLTVVEMGDRMVPRMMNRSAGNMIRRWCEKKGVAVFTGTRADGVTKEGDGLKVALSNGKALDADLIVVATGVKPNLEFLDGSGIETDIGILVNEYLETSASGVFAAGDVAEGFDFSTGARAVQAIQPTAADHARAAALNMTGANARFRGSLGMNVLDTLGLISTSFGLWNGVGGGERAEVMDEDNFRYIALEFDEDQLVGAITLGHTDHVGVLRGLIQTGTHLGPWKDRLVEDPTRIMEAYLAATQA
jgi:NAD(P)H-nitrite reductase large subunit